MNKIIVCLLTFVFAACSPKSTDKVKEVMPPWDSMPLEVKSLYVGKYKCPEATKVVLDIDANWDVSEVTEMDDNKVHTEVRQSPDNEEVKALLAYLHRDEGDPLIIMGMVPYKNEMSIAMDFATTAIMVAAEDVGADLSSISLQEATKDNTGKYFCFINGQ